MKIFHLSQNQNTDYDTYSDMVVIAKDEEDAKRLHPYQEEEGSKNIFYDEDKKEWWNFYNNSNKKYQFEDSYGAWVNDLSVIKVEYIGEAKEGSKRSVICASFHAG